MWSTLTMMKKGENFDEERENFLIEKKALFDQKRGVLIKEKSEQMTKNISLFGSFFFFLIKRLLFLMNNVVLAF